MMPGTNELAYKDPRRPRSPCFLLVQGRREFALTLVLLRRPSLPLCQLSKQCRDSIRVSDRNGAPGYQARQHLPMRLTYHCLTFTICVLLLAVLFQCAASSRQILFCRHIDTSAHAPP